MKKKPWKNRATWLALIQKWWDEMKDRRCQACGKKIWGENKTLYWDHLLDKAKYPEFDLEKNNHFFCCWDCHTEKGNGFPKPKHLEAIEKAKEQFLN